MTTEDIPDKGAHASPRRTLPAWLTERRTLLLAAAAAAGVGLFSNWSWLTAVGAAPILLAFVPCLAMCALGFCMRGGGAGACKTRGSASVRPGVPDVTPQRSGEL
jgi:hypothetical protein